MQRGISLIAATLLVAASAAVPATQLLAQNDTRVANAPPSADSVRIDGTTREWVSPGGARAQPYAMTQDDRGRLWYVETGVRPKMLVGFDPATEQFLPSTPVPSGGGAVRHMIFHAPTRSIWFGTDTGNIGRADVP